MTVQCTGHLFTTTLGIVQVSNSIILFLLLLLISFSSLLVVSWLSTMTVELKRIYFRLQVHCPLPNAKTVAVWYFSVLRTL